MKADVSQESLTLAGVWVIGEFGDVLLSNSTTPEENIEVGGEEGIPVEARVAVTEVEVLDLMEKILLSPYTNNLIRQFVLTSMTKLSTRFTSSTSVTRIRNLLHGFDNSIELELQSRAIEFGKLLDLENPSIKVGVLERMPMPEVRKSVMGAAAPTSERKLVRKQVDVGSSRFYSNSTDLLLVIIRFDG